MRSDLPETPIRASLVRPILLAGADRELVIIEAMACCLTILLSRFALLSFLLSAVAALFVHPLLVWIAKQDPDARPVYLRSLALHSYYPALSRPQASPSTHPSFPS